MTGVNSYRWCRAAMLAVMLALLGSFTAQGVEPTVEQLKARLSATSLNDKPKLCLQIAQRQLEAADKLYASAEIEKAQAALTDAVAFAELARDYAVEAHKHEKQTEIAVRGMVRKLNDILHTLTHEERPPVEDAIKRLQRVRDDLLASMFPKGVK